MEPLKPPVTVLCKLGSIIIHAQEINSDNMHEFDIAVFNDLCEDEEVKEWLEGMDKMALLPLKR